MLSNILKQMAKIEIPYLSQKRGTPTFLSASIETLLTATAVRSLGVGAVCVLMTNVRKALVLG